MPFILKQVPPSHGTRWLRDGFALLRRRPLGFMSLFVVFLLAALVVSLVPFLGQVLQMAMLPLLSLGFMVASQSALLEGPVKPSQFIEPLRGHARRRQALLVLCGLYGVLATLILVLMNGIAGGALFQLMSGGSNLPPAEIAAIAEKSNLGGALFTGALLGTLLTIPFWHAPALVHWADQGVGKALFSSTLAVWRSKGAFFVYGLAWMGLVLVFSFASGLLLGVLGGGAFASVVAVAGGLFFTTLFYVSLVFTFNDSFGGVRAASDPAP